MLSFSSKIVKTAQLRRTPVQKNDVTDPKTTLITSKRQLQQPFSSLIT